MTERDFKGIWIPKDIWLNKELSIVEKALLAEIDSLKVCNAGNDYFADFFGVSVPTITRAVAHLKELGLIEFSFDGRVRTLRLIKMIRQTNQNDEYINTSISNNLNNTNNQLNLFKDNNTSNKEDTYRERAQKFVDDYNSICVSLPKCQRLTPKRSRAIVKILKIFSDDEIIECFNKLEESDFCSGRSGKWRANFDFILSENNFTKILDGNYDNRERRCNVETISRGPKKQLSEEERERIIKNGQKF